MPDIKLADLDELYSVMYDLELLVYLQGLLEFDADDSVLEHGFEFAHRNAQSFLWKKELEAVQKLSALLCKEGFCKPQDSPI